MRLLRLLYFAMTLGFLNAVSAQCIDETLNVGDLCDQFGYAVALDGDQLLVAGRNVAAGCPGGGGGRGYLFYRDNGAWVLQHTFQPLDTVGSDDYAETLDIDGDVVVIGSDSGDLPGADNAGAAYIYRKVGNSWVEQKVTASDADEDDRFGYAVAVSDGVVAVGAFGTDTGSNIATNSGSVYVFEFDGTSWNETHKLFAPTTNSSDRLGTSVTIHGNMIIAGAPEASSDGEVYVFGYDGSSWSYQQQLVPNGIISSAATYGAAVHFDGERCIIGAPANTQGLSEVYVFRYLQGTWFEETVFSPSPPEIRFGEAVSISGRIAVVRKGRPQARVRLFERDVVTGLWQDSGQMPLPPNIGGLYGRSIEVSGSLVVIGGATAPPSNTGAAYIFDVPQSDCNFNMINDFCEIESGTPDCNDNGVPDGCDVGFGTSNDANGNGVPDECEERFVRGDANNDGLLNVADTVFALNAIFPPGGPGTGPIPSCIDAADANDDGNIDIGDPLTILVFLFGGGPPLPDPSAPAQAGGSSLPASACGVDPTLDDAPFWGLSLTLTGEGLDDGEMNCVDAFSCP